jgi:hypothetical protein
MRCEPGRRPRPPAATIRPGRKASIMRRISSGSGRWWSSHRVCTKSKPLSGGLSTVMSCSMASKLCLFICCSNWILMSVATTRPVGPTCSHSQAATEPPPAPTSRHRNPSRIPSAVMRRLVIGSRYCSNRDSLRLPCPRNCPARSQPYYSLPEPAIWANMGSFSSGWRAWYRYGPRRVISTVATRVEIKSAERGAR